jgi:hypothetical protein
MLFPFMVDSSLKELLTYSTKGIAFRAVSEPGESHTALNQHILYIELQQSSQNEIPRLLIQRRIIGKM